MNSQFIGSSADALNQPYVFIQKVKPAVAAYDSWYEYLTSLDTIDGMRLNNAIFRGGNVHNVISLDPLSISDMEVSLGPGSVLRL